VQILRRPLRPGGGHEDGVRTAVASDPPDALDELKKGYALKMYGNCLEAIPDLARSFELDARPKAALNLADCEAQVGEAELVVVADEQLAAVDKRLPPPERGEVGEVALADVVASPPWLTP
jgi:hypothetical protein